MQRPLIMLASAAMVAVAACGPRFTDEEVAAATARLRRQYLLRDYEAGVTEGRTWARRAPRAAALHAWYVQHLARDDQVDSAVAHAEALVHRDSTSPWSWFALAGALNWHPARGETALRAAERMLALAPDDRDVAWLAADVIRRQAGDSAAIAFVDSLPPALADHPLLLVRKAVALHALADARDNAALDREAYTVFAAARAADSLNVEAHYLAGAYLAGDRRLDEALPLLRRAAALTPAVEVHRAYWRAVLGQPDRTTEQNRPAIEADIASLLARRGEAPSTLQAVASAYQDLGLEDARRATEERLLAAHPYTEAAEWVLVERYRELAKAIWEDEQAGRADDPAKLARYRELLEAFVDRPRHVRERLLGDAYRELFQLMHRFVREDSAVDGGYLYGLVDGMVRYEGINPHVIYGQGAVALADAKTHLEDAAALARRGIDEAVNKIDEQHARGAYETEGDYQRALGWYTGIMYDALGWVYAAQGELALAEDTLRYALELDPDNLLALYHLGRLYERRHDLLADRSDAASQRAAAEYLAQAEASYIKGVMVQRPGENPNDDALEALYAKRHGTLDGWEAYLAGAAEIDRERRRADVLAGRVTNPAPVEPFTLASLRGPTVASPDLRGKIVVINFWGTWCGPCVVEMPEFQKFHEQYRGDADVVVLTINNDANPDDVRAWMTKHAYDFRVLWDDGYVNGAGVHVFPTTWFLDRQGRIAFVKEGWSESLAEEFSWRVEALRADGRARARATASSTIPGV